MTDAPEPDDTDPLAFVLGSAGLLGASMVAGFVLCELLRRKQGEQEQER